MIDWENIIETHGKRVWSSIYRITSNHNDTADCFQQTFVDALEFTQKQNVKNLSALLLTIATRRALDMLRQRKRFSTADSEQLKTVAGKTNENSAIEKKELSQMLIDALLQIDALEAKIFCLRHIEDLSYCQIAETCKLKTNHVGVIINRTKNKLQKILEKQCQYYR